MSMKNLNPLRTLLQGVAGQQTTLPYQAVIKALQLPTPAMRTLTQGLEILAWEDAVNQRPLVSAVVVQKGKPYPRPGFFGTAYALSLYDGPDEGAEAEMWHQDQLEKVWSYYSTPA
ncbi:hypothetical protein ACFOSD_07520 [Salinispirillum marinum]|uniref:Uncharacterized protein n=2 Tax=Saccharospirillaceae TaxID=255527 RepID=A0ABV8BDF4_9GAMM